MRWDEFLQTIGPLPLVEPARLAIFKNEDWATTRMQISRWCKSGRLIRLRRGLYAASEGYRPEPLSPLQVANHLYHPSYLSGSWALAFYGLSASPAEAFTSIATRPTRRFENTYGRFTFSSIQPKWYWGFHPLPIFGKITLIAEPEKALIDFWHLSGGEWTAGRMDEVGMPDTPFRQPAQGIPSPPSELDLDKLAGYARRFPPRVQRAAAVFARILRC